MTKRQRRELFIGLAFVSPWVIGFLWFTAYPVFASIFYSFTSFHLVENPVWIGFNNYETLFRQDELFWTSLKNTAYYTVTSVPLDLIVALFFAILLNIRIWGRSIFRTAFYLPTVVPTVASAILWIMLFNTDGGIINEALKLVHIPSIPWLSSPTWAMPALILLSVWGIGAAVIIFLAGLQDVPAVLYEAAHLDGAGALQCAWHVTLPMVSPVILFNFVLGLIGGVQVFTAPFIMTGGGPLNATLMYSIQLFNNAFVYYRMGYASAMAWILFAIIFILSLASIRMSRRYVHYE
ncbi:MAG: sugar ABC transporter permease [Chloroflexi bacterium]|nr:sugar ABC transporter permease [Chloroflexota bacterium]